MSGRKVAASLVLSYAMLCVPALAPAQDHGDRRNGSLWSDPLADARGSGRFTETGSIVDAPRTNPRTGTGSSISFSQFRIPSKARSLYEKAAKLMHQGKLDESRKKVDAALAICPKFSEALTLRGMLQFVAGKQTEAIADLQQAIAYDSSYALAYIGLGSALNSMERFNESMPILRQAERLAPSTWQTYFELARANLGKQEFTTALHNVDRASELQGGQQKESPELHLVRGYALLGLNDIPRAVGELQTYLARRPDGRIADVAHKVLSQLHETDFTATK